MIYTKWNKSPIKLNRKRTYVQEAQPCYKPQGLWFEVDGDWQRWCKAEDWGKEWFVIEHFLEFDPARVLHLESAFTIDLFHERYAIPCGTLRLGLTIDWPRVADEYAGIVIAPYCWERRMEYMWYYGWDCASGCIWDLSIITKFEVLTTERKETTHVTRHD